MTRADLIRAMCCRGVDCDSTSCPCADGMIHDFDPPRCRRIIEHADSILRFENRAVSNPTEPSVEQRNSRHTSKHTMREELEHLRSLNADMLEALRATLSDLEYYVNNPSAWDSFDEAMSERIGVAIDRTRAAIAKAVEPRTSADESQRGSLKSSQAGGEPFIEGAFTNAYRAGYRTHAGEGPVPSTLAADPDNVPGNRPSPSASRRGEPAPAVTEWEPTNEQFEEGAKQIYSELVHYRLQINMAMARLALWRALRAMLRSTEAKVQE